MSMSISTAREVAAAVLEIWYATESLQKRSVSDPEVCDACSKIYDVLASCPYIREARALVKGYKLGGGVL